MGEVPYSASMSGALHQTLESRRAYLRALVTTGQITLARQLAVFWGFGLAEFGLNLRGRPVERPVQGVMLDVGPDLTAEPLSNGELFTRNC